MRKLLRFAALSLSAALVLAAPPAFASSLDDAKAAGEVGEREDGKIGLVPGAPAGRKALVDEVNAKRRASYEQIARENKIPVEAVAARAGGKLVERAPAGAWVFRGGTWEKK